MRIGLAAAGGKNLEVFSPSIGRQLLELGLIDEIDLHIGLQAVPLTDDRPGRSSSFRLGRSTRTAVSGRRGIAAANEGGRWTKSVAVDHDLVSR